MRGPTINTGQLGCSGHGPGWCGESFTQRCSLAKAKPRSPSGCLKAGPWAQVPVLHWGGGACCSLGCMEGLVHALPSARGYQQDQTQPELREDAMPWLLAVSLASFYLASLQSPLERVLREQVIVLKAKGQSLALPFPDSLGAWESPGHPGMMGVYRDAGCG